MLPRSQHARGDGCDSPKAIITINGGSGSAQDRYAGVWGGRVDSETAVFPHVYICKDGVSSGGEGVFTQA